MNELYFKTLLNKSNEEVSPLRMAISKERVSDEVLSFSLMSQEERSRYPILNLDNLPEVKKELLQEAVLHQIKMQAGLGTSVIRDDLIFKYQGRSSLGSKSTDLFYQLNGEYFSIAELQVMQACHSCEYKNLKK